MMAGKTVTPVHAQTGAIGSARTAWPDRLLRSAVLGAASVLVCLLIYDTYLYVQAAHDAILYPFSLDYGEGIVWQQALLIPGPRMYGSIAHAPFIVFHYPPVYHLVVRAVAAFGFDMLASGRGVSVASALILCALCAWLAARALQGEGTRGATRAVGCIVAGLLPLQLEPVESWSMLMRVDLLATCLSFFGVCLVVEAVIRPRLLLLAVPMFALAVYTKQTSVAAPIAALAVSFTFNRRMTVIAGLLGSALGLIALGWLEWDTGGGFVRHILTYNVNRFSAGLLVNHLLDEALYAPLFLIAAAAFGSVCWKDRYIASKNVDASPTIPVVTVRILAIWFILATCMLVTLGKVGSSSNYCIELLALCAIPVGVLVAWGWQACLAPGHGQSFTWMRLVGVLLSVGMIGQISLPRPGFESVIDDRQLTQISRSLVDEIAAQTRPVLSEDMVLLMRAHQEVPLEPAIFEELAAKAVWDQKPFLDSLSSHAFAFLITLTRDRYTSEMLATIAQAYPSVNKVGPYLIHWPPGSSRFTTPLLRHLN